MLSYQYMDSHYKDLGSYTGDTYTPKDSLYIELRPWFQIYVGIEGLWQSFILSMIMRLFYILRNNLLFLGRCGIDLRRIIFILSHYRMIAWVLSGVFSNQSIPCFPVSKGHGAKWGPSGANRTQVGPRNFAIWVGIAWTKNSLMQMPEYLTNEKSTLVEVRALCHQAASHYLS